MPGHDALVVYGSDDVLLKNKEIKITIVFFLLLLVVMVVVLVKSKLKLGCRVVVKARVVSVVVVQGAELSLG